MTAILMGTAGHIDHGKTSLIRAMTGVDLDRLEEEKRRGITIELGFVAMDVGGGLKIGVVDVPGHERFIKTMVAGAQGIDMVMLVVAADEGVMPQTVEHLDICKLLDVSNGLVALTKTDRVDEETVMLAEEEVRELTAGTFLDGAPIIPCSAVSGDGLDELKSAIAEIAKSITARSDEGIFRLPVDRSFTIKGFGTVVTGSVIAGSVKKGDKVEIIPLAKKAAVRELEVHDEKVERAVAGQRLAMNLSGIERTEIGRGMWLAHPGSIRPTRTADVWLQSLKSSATLDQGTEILLHVGTAHVITELDLFTEAVLKPGDELVARLHMKTPVALLAGDRFVLRSFARNKTVAGGEALDPLPGERIAHRGRQGKIHAREYLRKLKSLTPENHIKSLVATSMKLGTIKSHIAQRAPFVPGKIESIIGNLIKKGHVVAVPGREELLIGREFFNEIGADIVGKLKNHHREKPMDAGISRGALRNLVPKRIADSVFSLVLESMLEDKTIKSEGDLISLKDHRAKASEKDDKAVNGIEKALESGGFTPPSPARLAESLGRDKKNIVSLLKYLVESGRALRVSEGLFYHPAALGEIERLLVKFLKENSEINAGEFKQLTCTSRKFAISLLEYFDRERVTIRVGDKRILRED